MSVSENEKVDNNLVEAGILPTAEAAEEKPSYVRCATSGRMVDEQLAEAIAHDEQHGTYCTLELLTRRKAAAEAAAVISDEEAYEKAMNIEPEPKPDRFNLARAMFECLESNQPWSKEIEERLSHVRTGKLSELLMRLQMRLHLYHPEPVFEACPDLYPCMNTWRPGPGKQNHLKFCPVDLILALRKQLRYFTSGFSDDMQRKMRHVYSIHLVPPSIQKRIFPLYGLTYIPGRHQIVFRKGHEYVDLHNLVPLVLSTRSQRMPDRSIVDVLDIKLYEARIDPDSRIVSFGGSGEDVEGNPWSGCTLARHFNFTPFAGAEKRILDARNIAVYEAGLDLFEAMEEVAVSGAAAQPGPEFPKIFLAFADEDNMEVELDAPGLQYATYRRVDRAMRKPDQGLNMAIVDKIKRKIKSFKDLETRLSKDELTELMVEVHGNEQRAMPDGTTLSPLEFFRIDSPQYPIRSALSVVAELSDWAKGRRVMLPDGSFATDACQVKCQVIKMVTREQLVGAVNGIEYDWTSAPLGAEIYFESVSND